MSRASSHEAGNSGKSWYKISASVGDTTDVYIYDEISWWGVNAEDFIYELNGINTSTINLHINSPGGDVFDGAAIANALKQHSAKVISHVEGLAASMASIIALAGDEVRMAENAFLMIHNPWVFIVGDARDLRKEADVLDKISETMITTYANASGQSKKVAKGWMDDESWFSAEESKSLGLCDSIEGEVDNSAVAKFDLSIFNKVPEHLKDEQKPDGWTVRDFEGFLRDSGFSRKEAASISSGGFKAKSQSDSDVSGLIEALRRNTQILKGDI